MVIRGGTLLETGFTALEGGLTLIGLTGTLETGATTDTALLEPTTGGVTWFGAVIVIGFTIGTLETALGRVLTGAGRGIGWAVAGLGLLEGAGVVVPMGGVLTVGLETTVLDLSW